MTQSTLSDYAIAAERFGQTLSDWGAGLFKIEEHNKAFILQMRSLARQICNERGSVSTDELRYYCAAHEIKEPYFKVWSAIFRGKEWKCFGRKSSEWPSNHGRMINVYGMSK